MEQYKEECILAKALYGQVLLCTDKTTGTQVAIKRMNLAAHASKISVNGRQIAEDIFMEKRVNRCVAEHGGHPSILRMVTDFVQDDHEHFVFDACLEGELYDVLDRSLDGKFDDELASKYFSQIVQGVAFLHECGYSHRDLSLENVLVNANDDCFVCDFGLASPLDTMQTQSVGKSFYMAPEVVSGKLYNPALADIWSLGIMLFIMLTGVPMFSVAQTTDNRYKYFVTHGLEKIITAWDISLSPCAISLLVSMLQVNPEERCSLDDILHHKFLGLDPVQVPNTEVVVTKLSLK